MPRKEQPIIAFTTTVTTKNDWDNGVGGWRCPHLNIPGAKVDDIFVKGKREDKGCYEVIPGTALIHWRCLPQPNEAVVLIKLTEKLSTEKETDRWKKLAIILPVFASIAAALIVAFVPIIFRGPSQTPPSGKEVITVKLTSPTYLGCGTVTIDGSAGLASDSQATITHKLWDWGDGSSQQELAFPAQHRYRRNGIYTVTVTAQASNNQTQSGSTRVNVEDADCK